MFHLPIRLPTTFLRMLCRLRAAKGLETGPSRLPPWHHGERFMVWSLIIVYGLFACKVRFMVGLWLWYYKTCEVYSWFYLHAWQKKTTHTVETLKLPTSLAVLSFMLRWTRPSKAIFGLFFKRLWTYFLKLKSGKIKTPQWVHTEGVCNYCGWLKMTCFFNPWRFWRFGSNISATFASLWRQISPGLCPSKCTSWSSKLVCKPTHAHNAWGQHFVECSTRHFQNKGYGLIIKPCLEIASWDYKGVFHHGSNSHFFEPNSMTCYGLKSYIQCVVWFRPANLLHQPIIGNWRHIFQHQAHRSHSIFPNIWKLVGGGFNHLEKIWSSSMGRMTSHYEK